ncbi:uncharacterized protein LOC125769006 [Anopheles funestus]|uniref:uncharacterized protein LOC125769006 n=1 Tax=Anopheles funestus TaxID=62324 RepID=UPI0020C6A450|nr:uncharacterized protein LOC125769006 [Anopheles funestus]
MATGNNRKETTTQLKSDHIPITSTSNLPTPSVSYATETIRNGTPNHMSLATMVMLRAYELHKDDEEFNFTITMNDSNDKHFDDVIVHYTSPQRKGALFIEAKDLYRSVNQHKQRKEHVITPEVLFSTKAADEPDSISKYLISFLNIDKQTSVKERIITQEVLTTTTDPDDIVSKCFNSLQKIDKQPSGNGDRYVVFTNSRLDHAAEKAFNVLVPEINDILSFASTMHSKCYQLDRNKSENLHTKLYNMCLEMLGQLMASHIYHRKLITHENVLFTMYENLIKRCVEHDCDKPCYHFTNNFQRDLAYGYSISTVTIFRHSLESAYEKLTNGNRDLYKDVEITIEKTFFKLPSTTSIHSRLIHDRLTDFRKKFVLVCCPTSADTLYTKILCEISKALPKTDEKSIFKELQDMLTDAVKHTTPIDPQCVQNAFTTAMLDKNMLKIATREYLKSLNDHCSLFMIKRECLKSTRLYTSLNYDKSSKILHYRGSSDTMINRTIVVKTVAILPSCKAVFVGHISPEIIQHLEQILINPTDESKTARIVITIAVQLDNATLERMSLLMASNCAHGKRLTTVKIILLENSTTYYDDPILVRDLTINLRRELFKRYEALPLFGTQTSLGTMVLPTDCLAHLKHVLNIQNDKNNVNICKLRYEKIKSWYIHRTICRSQTIRPYCKEKLSTPNFLSAIYLRMNAEYYKLGSCSFTQLDSLYRFECRYTMENTLLTNDTSKRAMDSCYDLRNKREKVKILLDESGAGKTAYFIWLAWRIQTQDPLLYVIHFNAAKHSSALRWISLNRSSTIDTELIRTLFKVFLLARTVRNMGSDHLFTLSLDMSHAERRETDRLAAVFTFAEGMVVLDEIMANCMKLTSIQLSEIRLFREKLNRKQVVFMLDGIDEVQPTDRTSVLQFAERLSHFDGVRELYLSKSQQFPTSEITLFANVEIYKLEPFTGVDAVLLLHRLLLNRLDAYRQCGREQQMQLVPFLYCSIANTLGHCHNVPLLLYMAFILHLPAIERSVDFKGQRVHGGIHLFSEKIDSNQLIATFVDKKLAVSAMSFLTGRATTNKHSMTSILKRQHALFGFCTVFDKQYTYRLLTDYERNHTAYLTQYINVDIMKAGFVTANHDGMPMFSKRIYAEYFAACWLFENRSRLGYKHHVMLLANMFADERFTTIRNIFNRKTIEGCEGTYFHSLLCNDSLQHYTIFDAIGRNKVEHVHGKDATARTLLHWLSSILSKPDSYAERNVETICERMLATAPTQQIDAKDELFGWSALDYAFFNEQFDVMRVLLKFGTKVNIDVWLHQLRTYDLVELLNRMDNLENYLVKITYDSRIIQDSVLARHVLSAVSSGVVKHILYEKDIDIGRPLAELDCLTVLEYCAMRDLFSLFEHFISITDTSEQTLADVGQRLLELSIEHGAYRVAMYLMKQSDSQWHHVNLPNIFKMDSVLLFAMELKSMKLFRFFFNKLCEQHKYPCIKEEDIVVESCKATIASDLSTHRSLYKDLCLYEDDSWCFVHIIEVLLATALYQTKFHIISYIVQKIKLSISSRLVAKLMRSKLETRVLPEASWSILNYLLCRTNDLHSVDDKGNTLFDYAIRCECVVMIQCLLVRGLDPKKHYAFHKLAWTDNEQRAIDIFQQLLPYCSIHDCYAPDENGYNVCENAILSKNFRIARMVIHKKAYYAATEDRVSVVLNSFMGLLKKRKFEPIFDFFTSSYEHADDGWKDVYAVIRRQVPIV